MKHINEVLVNKHVRILKLNWWWKQWKHWLINQCKSG